MVTWEKTKSSNGKKVFGNGKKVFGYGKKIFGKGKKKYLVMVKIIW